MGVWDASSLFVTNSTGLDHMCGGTDTHLGFQTFFFAVIAVSFDNYTYMSTLNWQSLHNYVCVPSCGIGRCY